MILTKQKLIKLPISSLAGWKSQYAGGFALLSQAHATTTHIRWIHHHISHDTKDIALYHPPRMRDAAPQDAALQDVARQNAAPQDAAPERPPVQGQVEQQE